MRKKFTLLVASLALLLGSSTVWGQQGRGALLPKYQNEQVTLRRGSISNSTANPHKRDTIHGPNDVNLVFGAGESSAINTQFVSWPATGGSLYSSSILVGSNYSKNAVIAIADNDGQAAGALHHIRLYGDSWSSPMPNGYTPSNVGYYQLNSTISAADALPVSSLSAYKISGGSGIVTGVSGSSISGSAVLETTSNVGGVLKPFRDVGTNRYIVPVWNHISMGNAAGWDAQVVTQGDFYFNLSTADTLYTSTRYNALDDGKSLLYTISGSSLPYTSFTSKLSTVNYVRPTTVLLSGVNTLDNITIGDVEWYAAFLASTYQGTTTVGPTYTYNAAGCGHLSGWTAYQRDNVTFDTISTQNSGRLVDAAVRLLDGADICVTGAVTDRTAVPYTIGAPGDNITDAFLVLPGANGGAGRKNFRIKIGGNANMLHTQDMGAYTGSNPLMDNYLYSDAGAGPGKLFPRAQSAIWLSGGGASPFLYNNEVSGLNWSGYGALTDNTNADKTKWRPYASTNASVYGVGGSYNGGTDIHTRTIDSNDTTSIIQIGSFTNNQNRFNIYSGGMLKNFRSVCVPICDSLVIGRDNLAPVFHLTHATMPLYIINDGDGTTTGCCNAGIRFHTAGVNSLNLAITSATGGGDLHIQAHSYVNMYDNINFVTTLDNNAAVLSDAGYAQTKNFTYTGGTGNLTLWTKGQPSDLGGCDGYIFMAGAVNVTNSGTKANGSVLYGTVPGSNTINSCITLVDQAAFSTTALGTKIQTRIQSDNDSVSISGLYTHINPDAGALLVQGDRKVNFQQGAIIDLTGGTSDVAIQSKNANVEFGNLLTYSGDQTTDLFIDGETGVTFSGGSITQPATATNVNVGVQSNKGTILFRGAPFAFDVTNTDYVQVWADKNIDVRSALTYNDHPGTATHVHFFAKDSLLTNAHWGGAPVTFTVGNTNVTNTLTDWIAGANIHTSDLVIFNYGNTGNNVEDLTLKSLGGNMVMDRAVNVTYDSENTVLFSAELDCAERNTPNAGYNASGTGGNRNIFNGNISMNDSLNIIRTNINPGNTDILSAYNIRTAMVTINDQASTGNNTTIESHKGDIFLGYSAVADGKTTPAQSAVSYDLNRFVYNAHSGNTTGKLSIQAGYDDQINTLRDGGGNIYFTHIDATMAQGGNHPTEIKIPFSNEYICKGAWTPGLLHERLGSSMKSYEHAGIIGGVGRNGNDANWGDYAPMQGPNGTANDTSLIYRANKGNLTVDAGTRGNIIMNTGSFLDFQGDNGNGFFRTRYGDIDMRGETNATNLNSSLLFLASSDEANKWITGVCGCNEERNNVYLQDFQYTNGSTHNGSVFVGADNNIKLNYGGLTNRATQADPFLSKDYDVRFNWGTPYNGNYHCDLNPTINQARNFIMNFTGVNGGFAAVAADRIDVYKPLIYTGGTGTGMSAVPGQGSLQGENVAGYGLYMKTTSVKDSWTFNGLEGGLPKCPFTCTADDCGSAALHNIVRMTFHDDARIIANNQRVLLASPVIESFGHMELDVANSAGSKTAITIQADSLIFHDSLILNETLTNEVKMIAWSSSLKTPILKLGYKRTSPPVQEIIYDVNGKPFTCNDCITHTKGDPKSKLDTMVVMFKNAASFERFESTIVDHTVITFLTDSFDHVDKGLIQDARIYTNLFKVRNQVEFWRDAARTRDGHFELISEPQMFSKDYAGIYTRHLHMEPIGACGRRYSDLWLCDPALDVITTSTFGGYGTIHADVHVEIEAKLAPGYASLGLRGNCYEQKAGTLSMENLRLDKGAEIYYTIGDVLGFDGEYTDCIEADEITMYGDVFISIEKRACEKYVPGCYPIIRYNTVAIGESNLNNLKLKTKSIDGVPLTLDTSTPGVVYLCVGDGATVSINREVHIPQVPGVTLITPAKFGNYYIASYGNFNFKVKYDSEPPLKVTTNRIINGVTEELIGKKNANGEYEYVIGRVQQNISLKFGPEFATDNMEIVDGKAIWSHGSTIYIRVEKEDIASIYSIAGQLVKRVELSEGNTPIPMTRGIYIVTLIDGSVHKVILK